MPAFSVPANLAFDSYTDLVAAISDWLNRSDLTGSAQSMIALAEARMRRELVPHFSEVSTSVTSVDGVAALPADYGTLNRVTYSSTALPQVSPAAALGTGSGTVPVAYTLEAGGLRLWPSGDYTVTLLYQPLLPQLSEANPTNTLLDNHPDLYFYGAMLFAEGYVANDTRAGLFKGLWDEALAEVKQFMLRQRYAGPLVPFVGFVP